MSPVIKSLKGKSNELPMRPSDPRTKRRSPLRPRGLNGFSWMSRHYAERLLIRANAPARSEQSSDDSLLYDRQPLSHLGYQPRKKQERPASCSLWLFTVPTMFCSDRATAANSRRRVHDISEA